MSFPKKILYQASDDKDDEVVSLCCSSLSSSECSEEVEQKKKVVERRYSRLAYSIHRVVLQVEKDEPEQESSDMCSIDISFPESSCIHSHSLNGSIIIPPLNGDNSMSPNKTKKQKVAQKRYSRLAYSVQRLGNLDKKV
mmetsp:Transcript_2142/g.2909  ORF Transcript_2142/g.2909 Transcript_2142/m.2909 type:complete len:139 (-) Transcript_2142:1703-2119(-)